MTIFGKKLLLRCLTGFWIHLQNFIILGKKLVFRKWSSSKVYIPRKSSEENKMDNRFIDIILKYRVRNTAWKVSVFGVFLVRIFPNLDWMRRNWWLNSISFTKYSFIISQWFFFNMTLNQQRNLSFKTGLKDYGTGWRSFMILLPEPSKVFELDVYFDNQIMSSLWDIFIFLCTQYQIKMWHREEWKYMPCVFL